MTTYGKTVRIYLADGLATSGIRHAEITNWTGQAIVCPRVRVAKLLEWSESQRPGVYFLFGEGQESFKIRAYIGEAENVFKRLMQHASDPQKDFWEIAIFFTSKDDYLTKAHVKYLESKLIKSARDSGRFALENLNNPPPSSLPRSDKDAMEEFLESIKILIAALGFPIQDLPRKSDVEAKNVDTKTGPLANVRLFFEAPKIGVKAEGVSLDDGFVVFAGSRGLAQSKESLSSGWLIYKKELINQGDIVLKDEFIELSKDIRFSSSSAAAAILCGGPRNGRDVMERFTR